MHFNPRIFVTALFSVHMTFSFQIADSMEKKGVNSNIMITDEIHQEGHKYLVLGQSASSKRLILSSGIYSNLVHIGL